jgi:hypothetical protein
MVDGAGGKNTHIKSILAEEGQKINPSVTIFAPNS